MGIAFVAVKIILWLITGVSSDEVFDAIIVACQQN